MSKCIICGHESLGTFDAGEICPECSLPTMIARGKCDICGMAYVVKQESDGHLCEVCREALRGLVAEHQGVKKKNYDKEIHLKVYEFREKMRRSPSYVFISRDVCGELKAGHGMTMITDPPTHYMGIEICLIENRNDFIAVGG